MSIDLHIHSVFSDGTYTPYEIVSLAKRLGLTAIAVTDHDTISGTEDTFAAANSFGLEAVSGIELSVRHGDTFVHMLGYYIDHQCRQFNEKITRLQQARKERNIKIIEKLNAVGIAIDIEEVAAVSMIGQTGRPHIAQVLRNKGVVKSHNEAFDKYLRKGAAAYVSRFIYESAEAIDMIKKGGGFAVLAHPAQIDPTLITIPKLIDEMVKMGLDGLEIYYPTHSMNMRKKLKSVAEKYGLIITGGSDFHGDIRPGTSLAGGINVDVPDEVLENMKQRWVLR